MGITVDASRPPVALPTVVSSPDGYIKAIQDRDWAGVLLRANFTALNPQPTRISFYRGDGTLVRGGDNVYAAGGKATTYDHEIDLGAATSWYAVTNTGVTSQGVGLLTAAPATGVDDPSTWVKSLDEPNLSIQVAISSWPKFDYASDAEVVRIPGRESSVASYDVMQLQPTQAKFYLPNAEESDQFEACISSGVIMVQTAPTFHRPSFFALASTATREDASRMEQQTYTWTVTLVPVERPPTIDQPARIPGRSYADRLERFPRYNDVPSQPYSAGQGAVGY